MIDWGKIREAAKAWAERHAGLPAVMDDDPRPWTGKAVVLLRISGSVGIGIDEARYEQEVPDADLVPTYCGPRAFTLGVRIVSRSQAPDADAFYYLEVLRTSLARESVKAAFREAGMSVAQALAVVPVAHHVDGRAESMAVMDLLMNAVSSVTDRVSEPTSFIEQVELTSTLSPSSGLDLDEDLMP